MPDIINKSLSAFPWYQPNLLDNDDNQLFDIGINYVACSGSIALSCASTGVLYRTRLMAGAASVSAAATGLLSAKRDCSGSMQLGLTASGNINAIHNLQGQSAIAINVIGQASTIKALSGNAAISSAIIGSLTRIVDADGSVSIVFDAKYIEKIITDYLVKSVYATTELAKDIAVSDAISAAIYFTTDEQGTINIGIGAIADDIYFTTELKKEIEL